MFESIAFYVFSVLTLVSFWVVVRTNNILYALGALALGMILISGFFFLLDAEFLGVVQIMVYTGAIVVLYAFGMMFFDMQKDVIERYQHKAILWFLCIVVVIVLVVTLGNQQIPVFVGSLASSSVVPDTKQLAHALFRDYIVAFEAAAIMLLMAMIAGVATGLQKVYMFKEDKKDSKTEHKGDDK
ncbi:hypothetical protein BKH43_03695 [Helicobacter sp. 13S00401-1]|uniref:NADH-quinone oxidoreductase subunit J n=1 Tax=Helicobacter sp. 13S00401-1 TaxID=1905758 RepID=UPI000BA5203C|nr:NADH-quinone oxidoreductase subunit J [Helicobacter sp. 13S00401-1]PAF50970.1 hypothetical protein BKH43_03695 [Helicobacter sp. 13S00401-1]